MIALLSSRSSSGSSDGAPPLSVTSSRSSSSRMPTRSSGLSSSPGWSGWTRLVAASVTASLRSATSSGPSGVSRHTADSASRTSTKYSGLAGIPSETSRLSWATSIPGQGWRLRGRGWFCIATGALQPGEAGGNLVHKLLVQRRVRRDGHRHLKVGTRAEQRTLVEGLPGGIRHHRAGFRSDQCGSSEVVRRVVQHGAVSDPLELLAHPRNLFHEQRARLDVGVEAAVDDAHRVEAGRAQVEARTADGGDVDQVTQHLDERARRSPTEAEGPEHPIEPLVRR